MDGEAAEGELLSPPSPEKIAYTPQEVAHLTSCSKSEVMAAIHRGDLAAKKRGYGRLYLITKAAIYDWIDSMPDAE